MANQFARAAWRASGRFGDARSVALLQAAPVPLFDSIVPTSCGIATDGLRITAGGSGGRLRRCAPGQCRLQEYDGHNGAVCAVKYSSDGSRIFASGLVDRAEVRAADSGGPDLFSLRCLAGARASFSPDGRHVVARQGYGTGIIWDLFSGAHAHKVVAPGDYLGSCVFSQMGWKLRSRASAACSR